jgi:hypothetical protein
MRRFLVLALFAGLIVCLTMPDASALGRRRRGPSYVCASCSCEPARGVTFSTYDCSGGTGTYDPGDTFVGGYLLQLSTLHPWPCNICRSDRGKWCLAYPNPKNLPPDNYALVAVFKLAGHNSSPSFHCPPP